MSNANKTLICEYEITTNQEFITDAKNKLN